MDIDGDNFLDLVSGGFNSTPSLGYAPVYVMKGGTDKLKYKTADHLHTVSGKVPLMNSASCTKPCFADLNNDGLLDLIYGDKRGRFFQFNGVKSKQGLSFSDEGKIIRFSDAKTLKLDAGYSSPHFTDWDGDGDLDLLSGSKKGGVFYFENEGTPEDALWAKPLVLLSPLEYSKTGGAASPYLIAGPDPAKTPQYVTCVTTVDYNQDAKLDLVIGDHSTLGEDYESKEFYTNDIGNVWVMLRK